MMVWQKLINRLASKNRSNGSANNDIRKRSKRRLLVETLTKRELMAADLGAISGIAFTDSNGDGVFEAGDVRLEGVQVQLFRDNGAGNVGSLVTTGADADQLVATDLTDTSAAPAPGEPVKSPGEYRFEQLSPGDYWVVQDAVSGQEAPAPILVTISETDDDGVRTQLIDDYSTTAVSVLANASNPTNVDSAAASEAIGGSRDIQATRTNASGNILIEVDTAQDALTISSGGGGEGTALIQYDGPDNSITLDPTGLGGVSLSAETAIDPLDPAGAQRQFPGAGIIVQTRAADAGETLLLTVYTDAANFSTTTVTVPVDAVNFLETFVQFDAFTVAGGTGADFRNVGAIEASSQLTGDNDIRVSIVEAIRPEPIVTNLANIQPLTLGGDVFLDNGAGAFQNDGFRDGSEPLISSPITVQLFRADQNPATDTPIDTTTTTAGTYQFDEVDPGDYVVVIPESNFAAAGPLFGLAPSTNVAVDPNNDVDNDSNGSYTAGVGLVTGTITLVSNAEPIDDADTDPNTNTTIDFGVFPQVDLSITKTINQAASDLRPGGQVVFDIVVQNDSPTSTDIVAATNAIFTDTLPTGLSNPVFSGLPAGAGTPTVNGLTASVNLGTIDPDQAGVTFQITADISAALTDSVTNTATVETVDQVDVDTTNNSDPEDVVLESADLRLIKTGPATTPNAGTPIAYTISVFNDATGATDAADVVVVDTLPVGVDFVSGSIAGGTGTQTVTFDSITREVTARIDNLAAGVDAAVITLNVTIDADAPSPITNAATVSSSTFDPDLDNNTDDFENTVDRVVDVAISKAVETGDVVVAGGTFTYEFTVTNTGPGEARDVTVTDALAAALTLVSFDAGTSDVTRVAGDDQNLTFDVGTLGVGESKSFSIDVSLLSSATGTLDNTAVVTTTDTDSDDTNNSDSTSDPITRDVDLLIEKSVVIAGVTDGRTDAVPGQDELLYTITVRHDASSVSDALDVVITDTLPTGLLGDTITIIDNATGDSSSFNTANQIATVTLGTVAIGQVRTFTILTNTIDEAATGTLTNTASLDDPADGVITATAETTLTPDFDVVVEKEVSNAAPEPGATVVYTVTVNNEGPSTASGVILTDTIPAGLTFVSGTLNNQNGTSDGSVVTFPAITLDSGSSATATLTFTVGATAAGQITNTASVPDLSAAGENTIDNNSDTADITVTPVVDLTVSKTVSSSNAKAGDTLTYTVTVSNAGPSTAAAVTAVDTLPAGVTFVSGTGPNDETLSAANGVVTVNGGSLASGDDYTFTILATVNAGVTATQVNSVAVSTTTNESDTDNNSASASTTVDPQTSTIDGFVFIDANNNSQFDAGETPVSGVTVELTGTDAFGNTVSVQDTTGADGLYEFDNLFAGTYQVQRIDRPDNLRDGGEQAGTGANATIDAVDNAFTALGLESADAAEDFNFGLLTGFISKRDFLASS
ncbi:Large cysteine-rich periplasmic protein OmcB precursor [Novipirellula aureliae]|uniref:Large cysteine-rich periplasmic protein OmcB n=1 Tax=Novipirellula aureliae TaxID=2527966 RepID=A0A5C6E1W7_9BACT|nr:SdrD B-like domain-containing protein [Novipirellula aureliae]TWU41376.1 Large cysteine-rich periplasmic protein OmcB precursor [Novipirellula aureliae]